MNLAFLPGDLHLRKNERGQFVVTMAGQELICTASQRAAVAKFNSIRKDLETKLPSREPTPQEKSEFLRREVGDSLVGHNSLGGRKKKGTAGSTRTFGG